MNLKHPYVRKGSIKRLLSELLRNIMTYVCIYLEGPVLIDAIINNKDNRTTDERKIMLYIVAVVTFVPTLIEHVLDYRQCFWKIGGTSRKTLQANLLRKYMFYNDSSRNMVNQGTLTMAITKNSFDLVTDAYLQVFPIISSV